MNRVAVNIMQSRSGSRKWWLIVSLMLGLAACGSGEKPVATPQIRIEGEIATALPPTRTPPILPSPSPTFLPTRTPWPTPRQVTVNRVNNQIDPALVTPLAEGAFLPDLTLIDIDGQPLVLQQIDRPLVLNFWSIGCGSCFYEFPLLKEFVAYHGADQLAVISINIAELPAEMRIIADQLQANFPTVVDAQAELFTTYFRGAVVPTTIFITAEGRIAQVITGPLDAYNLDLQLQALGLPPFPNP